MRWGPGGMVRVGRGGFNFYPSPHLHIPPNRAASSPSHSLTLSQAAEALESLDSYPAEPEVHAYLLDRLTRVTHLDQLYELHYQMITLGKVRGVRGGLKGGIGGCGLGGRVEGGGRGKLYELHCYK